MAATSINISYYVWRSGRAALAQPGLSAAQPPALLDPPPPPDFLPPAAAQRSSWLVGCYLLVTSTATPAMLGQPYAFAVLSWGGAIALNLVMAASSLYCM